MASTNIATPNVLEHWKTYNSEILKHERAEYGEQIVISLNASLVEEYGNGWKEKHLRHCLRIAKTFPDPGIVYALRRQLSWTHLSSFCTLKMN